jgi:hypothetical protein
LNVLESIILILILLTGLLIAYNFKQIRKLKLLNKSLSQTTTNHEESMKEIKRLQACLDDVSLSEAQWQISYRKICEANVNAEKFSQIIDSYELEQRRLYSEISNRKKVINDLEKKLNIVKIKNSTQNALDYANSKESYSDFQKKIKRVRDAELV